MYRHIDIKFFNDKPLHSKNKEFHPVAGLLFANQMEVKSVHFRNLEPTLHEYIHTNEMQQLQKHFNDIDCTKDFYGVRHY